MKWFISFVLLIMTLIHSLVLVVLVRGNDSESLIPITCSFFYLPLLRKASSIWWTALTLLRKLFCGNRMYGLHTGNMNHTSMPERQDKITLHRDLHGNPKAGENHGNRASLCIVDIQYIDYYNTLSSVSATQGSLRLLLLTQLWPGSRFSLSHSLHPHTSTIHN